MELPPRARRILYQLITMIFTDGTTSACAENTLLSPGRRCRRWNYLRVRGEYQKDTERKTIMQELPPRARRIPLGLAQRPVCRGTTSACAENTHAKKAAKVRGLELPPRARRILGATPFPLRAIGTTSACAENTAVAAIYRCCRGNYLRVRGEY